MAIPSNQEVAVVGASAAGLFAAARLAAAGRPVEVLERAADLDPVPRTLIVTRAMLDIVGDAGVDSVVNEISRFELFADGKAAEIELSRPDLIIERSRLIAGLARQATGAGARIRFGQRVSGLAPARDGVALQVGQEHLRFGAVVGADGARSRVARAAGWAPLPTVSLVQALVDLPPDVSPGTSKVWFRPEDTPYFYWLIPEGPGRGALGVIGADAPSIRRHLDRFLEEQDLKPLSYQAAVIPAYTRWVDAHRRIGNGDVYLVGDAGAQVKVSTVGGIVTGFRGAAAVANAILHGDKSELKALRRELNVHLLIRRALNTFEENDYRYLIGGMTRATDRALSKADRDHAARAMLEFVRAKPGIALRAARAMLRGANPTDPPT